MKKLLSLEALLLRLVSRGREIALQKPEPTDDRLPTSIRLKPTTKQFLEAQAEAMNTSSQAVINMILDGVAQTTIDEPISELRAIRERFFLLASVHGLDLLALVDLLRDRGFTLPVLGDHARLLELLTSDTVAFLAKTFGVQVDWLRGHGRTIARPEVQWYKDVAGAGRVLLSHKRADLRPELMFLRRSGANFEAASRPGADNEAQLEPVGVVLRLNRRNAHGTPFVTYHLWEFERWNYWRCREQLKHLIALCEQLGISVVGHELPKDAMDELVAGQEFPALVLARLGSISWHPDDYASFRFKVQRETEEWSSVAKSYRDSSALATVAAEAGAHPVPDKPWEPANVSA